MKMASDIKKTEAIELSFKIVLVDLEKCLMITNKLINDVKNYWVYSIMKSFHQI